MKKIVGIFITISLLLIVLVLVGINKINNNKLNASINTTTNNIGIECTTNEIKVGNTTSCVLKGNSLSEIQLFEGKLTNSSNVSISNIHKNAIWVIGSDDANMQLISNGVSGVFEIITFNVTGVSAGSGTIGVDKLKNNLYFVDKNINSNNLDSISYNIKVLSDGNSNNNNNTNNNSTNNNNNSTNGNTNNGSVSNTLIISSKMYKINNEKLLIENVPNEHSNEDIKNNLIISNGVISVNNDKVTITYNGQTKVYTIVRVWLPHTGQAVLKYTWFIILFAMIITLLFLVKRQNNKGEIKNEK